MKRSYFLILGLLIASVMFQSCKYKKPYFSDFDMYLKGEIVYTEHDDGAWFINCLKVDTCNYETFDQRDSLDVFYILKRFNYALFYSNGDLRGLHEFEIGDIVEIIGSEKKLICLDSLNNNKFEKETIIVSKSFFPYKRISEIAYLFDTKFEEFKNETQQRNKRH